MRHTPRHHPLRKPTTHPQRNSQPSKAPRSPPSHNELRRSPQWHRLPINLAHLTHGIRTPLLGSSAPPLAIPLATAAPPPPAPAAGLHTRSKPLLFPQPAYPADTACAVVLCARLPNCIVLPHLRGDVCGSRTCYWV